MGKKKIIVLGSIAGLVCEMLGGTMEINNSQLELLEIHPTADIFNIPYMKKYQDKPELVESNHVLRYSVRVVAEVPSESKVILTCKNKPCVYFCNQVLAVHANPELSVPFIENLFCTELVSQNLLSEEAFEIAKKTWEDSAHHGFGLIRNVCECFLFGQ